jgi:hypothetical protein
MHILFVEDHIGDVVDHVEFCSDVCHTQWCMWVEDVVKKLSSAEVEHKITDYDLPEIGIVPREVVIKARQGKGLYEGWNGCNEASTSTLCNACDEVIEGLDEGLAPAERDKFIQELREISQRSQDEDEAYILNVLYDLKCQIE